MVNRLENIFMRNLLIGLIVLINYIILLIFNMYYLGCVGLLFCIDFLLRWFVDDCFVLRVN